MLTLLFVVSCVSGPARAADDAAALRAVGATPVPAAAPTASDAGAGGPKASAPAATRPRIGLVLSGGGARGLAHVGVLQALRELRVPVDLVVGTSMGAVVGGAYAAGHPLEALQQYAVATDWNRVFDPVGDRRDLDFRRRVDDAVVLPAPTLRAGAGGVTLSPAAFGSFELEMLLQRIAAPVRDTQDLDQLPVRYRSVAADLVTGDMVLLRDTTLFTAMRASMSVPGAFAPLRVDGRLLVDGGIVRNLPVDVARALGADIVIAVNVGAPPAGEAQLKSSLDIALQMVALLIQQNVRNSLLQLGSGDVLVQPDLTGISSADFSQPAAVVARGRAAALSQAPALSRLALSAEEYARWEAARQLPQSPPTFKVERVDFQGTQRTDPRGLSARLPFGAGEQIDEQKLEAGLRRLYATGDFDRIDYELVPVGTDARRVLLRPQERSGGLDSLRFGWQLESDLGDLNRFNVAASYLRPWINAYGGEWRTLVQLGSARRVQTELYQPLGRDAQFFVTAGALYAADDTDLYANERKRVARVGVRRLGLETAIGARLGTLGELRLGVSRNRYEAEFLISESFDGRIVGYESSAQMSISIDALDSANFPREGYGLNVSYSQPLGRKVDVSRGDELNIVALAPLSWRRHTVLVLAEYDRVRGGSGAATIGGFLNLSGTPPNSAYGSRATLLSAVYFYQLAPLPRSVGRAVYVGASLEIGRLDNGEGSFSLTGFRRANAALIGLDTLLGPVYFAVGRTQGGASAVYLYVGRR